MSSFKKQAATVLLAAGLATTGCADDQARAVSSGPGVVGVARDAVVVGEQVVFYAQGLAPADADLDALPTEVQLVFEGAYAADDGQTERVSFDARALVDGRLPDGREVVRLNRFGPFRNPFSAADRPGRFRGTVKVVELSADGAGRVGPARDLEMNVLPSLVIDAFEPLDATCGAPALRALAGIPYRLSVRAVGISPVRFDFDVANVNGRSDASRVTHDYGAAGGPVGQDTLGEDEPVLFNPVPEGEQFYVTLLRAVAYDAEGRSVETVLPVSVHRPVEVVHNGKLELAEIYDPVPVSGCIPGSINTEVEYEESVSEERQRSVSVTVSRDWGRSNGTSQSNEWERGIEEGESTSQSIGTEDSVEEETEQSWGVDYEQSESAEIGFSTSNGESWSWSMSEGTSNSEYESRMNEVFGEGSWSGTVGVEGSGSVPGFAKVTGKASTTVGVEVGASTGTSAGTGRTTSAERGFSASGQTETERSYGSAVSESRSQSLSGSYALSNQRSTSRSNEAERSMSRTWSLGEGLEMSEVISEGISESEEQTWEESSSIETSTGISGAIPRGRYGIWYRQTTRSVRRAEVRSYDLCGVASHLGELQFNEWTWAPELAIGETCDPLPASRLPKARCLIEPCGG
ncbi:MAG: hypothetical protein ACOYM9_06955 [Bradymonadia bacterium]|jgi:hypothetical protein